MQDFINKIKNEISTLDDLEKVRVEIFGKKGILAQGFAKLKELGEDEKKEFAANLNKQRDELSALIEAKKAELGEQEIDSKMKKEAADITLFNEPVASGALHPVMATMDKIIEYFLALNFSLETGPLIEDDFHNFEALNLPKYHPARDMQDTFYLDDFRLLRTHTSPVQVRTMLNQKPPIRMIAPGTVFRRDMDLTHTPMFHQVEGLVVEDADKVSFANLKSMLENFLKRCKMMLKCVFALASFHLRSLAQRLILVVYFAMARAAGCASRLLGLRCLDAASSIQMCLRRLAIKM